MSTHQCCKPASTVSVRGEIAPSTTAAAARRTVARRGITFASWAIPGATLALLPKCPVCLAAYVALWTGLTLSVSAASHLRSLLLFACVASLTLVTAGFVRRFTTSAFGSKRMTR
jgi:hypothetical protein